MIRLLLLASLAPLLGSVAADNQMTETLRAHEPPASSLQGTIVGRVADRNGTPLPEVMIFMAGDQMGSLSRTTGEYTILNVPAGTYEIRAQRLGFTSESRLITVEEGARLEVNFELNQQAIGLREIRSDGREGAAAPRDARPSLRPAGPPRAALGGPSFTPMIVRPEIMNVAEVQRAMAAAVPAAMRAAGASGTVRVWFYVSDEGNVESVQVISAEPSLADYTPALINSAREVAGRLRFSPAYNYDRKIPVWVQVPLTFTP